MSKNLIWYDPADSNMRAVFDADRFVRMSKEPPRNWQGLVVDEHGEKLTFIYLDNGEVLASNDSMKTIGARLEAGD